MTKKSKHFTGRLIISDLDGKFLNGYLIRNGQKIAVLEKSKPQERSPDVTLQSLKRAYQSSSEWADCPYIDKSWCQLAPVYIYTQSDDDTTDPFEGQYDCEEPSGSYATRTRYSYFRDKHCSENYGRVAWEYYSDTFWYDDEYMDDDPDSDPRANALREPSTGPTVSTEDRIKNKLTNPCAKSVFKGLQEGLRDQAVSSPEQILEDGTKLNFSKIILKLFDDSSKTDLTIQNGNLGENVNGSTTKTTITIDNTYLKRATKLAIARTMIHESIHAYLNAYFNGRPDFQDASFKDKILGYARDRKITEMGILQHEFMGQYIDHIGYSLREWDKVHGTGGNLGWDYYRSMAFAGLFQVYVNGKIANETDVFKELVPNKNDRQKTADIVFNENLNNNHAKGTKCD